jgi:hypothetical protein
LLSFSLPRDIANTLVDLYKIGYALSALLAINSNPQFEPERELIGTLSYKRTNAGSGIWNSVDNPTFCYRVGTHTIQVWIVHRGAGTMESIIYLVGLIVVVMFILSLLGLH